MTTPHKQTVLITGCSTGGLGHALALSFHAHDYFVIATARTPSKMSSLSSLGITTLELDVLSPTSISSCVSAVSSLTGGKLDMLVNNAGAGYISPLLDADLEEGKKVFDLNVWSVLAVTQAFAPLLIEAKGRVVNNTSVCSVMHSPWQGVYNASKSAAAMLTSNLRLELAPFGVRVVDLRTGVVASNFHENREPGQNVLVEGSRYSVARREIEDILKDCGVPKRESMPAEVWAGRVVGSLEGGRAPCQVWKGKFATGCWVLGCFMPSWIVDWMFSLGSGLKTVRKRLGERERGGQGKVD